MTTEEVLHELIPGFSRYFITENGVIFSKIRNRVLKGNINADGYFQCHIIDDNGISLVRRVHRLVALTYIPNPNNYPVINHKDGNKLNNHYSNLEWCTPEFNSGHAAKMGLYDIRYGVRNHASKPVLNLQTGIFYETIKEAAHTIGMDKSDFRKRVLGIYKNNTNFILA